MFNLGGLGLQSLQSAVWLGVLGDTPEQCSITEAIMASWHYFPYSPETVFVLRELAKLKRRDVCARPSSGKIGVCRRRFAKHCARKLLRKFKKRSHFVTDPRILVAKFNKSVVAQGYYPERSAKNWRNMIQRSIITNNSEISLENFSYIDNPLGVCEALNKLARLEMVCSDIRINFNDNVCLDIGAYLVLAAMKKDMAPVISGGVISPSIRKVLEAVRLSEELGMMKRAASAETGSGLWAFPTVVRRPAGSSLSLTRYLEPQSIEKVAKSLVEAINEWLSQIVDQELTEAGRRLVQKTVGEVLDNAERHSDLKKDGDWSIAGFLARQKLADGRTVFRCHLAFLSVGKTIAETFARADVSVRADLDKYIAKHTNALTKRRLSEGLATVFALQDGITSDPQAFSEGRGGTGLQDVISFIDDLAGGENPEHDAQLAIISGNTHIRIRHPHHKGVMDELNRRQLWFNAENSPEFPPDTRHVTMLPHRLNGTLVTAAFNLEKEYLESSIDG
jgi:hypothetical protein